MYTGIPRWLAASRITPRAWATSMAVVLLLVKKSCSIERAWGAERSITEQTSS